MQDDNRRLEALAAKRQWTKEEALQILEFMDQSGETVASLCRRLGIAEQRIYWWRSRLWKIRNKSNGGSKPKAKSLIPVKVIPTPAVEVLSNNSMVLHITSYNSCVEIPHADSQSALWVAALIRALNERN
jgi:transposase-like protein